MNLPLNLFQWPLGTTWKLYIWRTVCLYFFLDFRWNQLQSSDSPPCFVFLCVFFCLCCHRGYVLHLPVRVFLGAREQFYLKQLMLEWQVSARAGDTRRFSAALCCINLHNNDESSVTLGLRGSCSARAGTRSNNCGCWEPPAKHCGCPLTGGLVEITRKAIMWKREQRCSNSTQENDGTGKV